METRTSSSYPQERQVASFRWALLCGNDFQAAKRGHRHIISYKYTRRDSGASVYESGNTWQFNEQGNYGWYTQICLVLVLSVPFGFTLPAAIFPQDKVQQMFSSFT